MICRRSKDFTNVYAQDHHTPLYENPNLIMLHYTVCNAQYWLFSGVKKIKNTAYPMLDSSNLVITKMASS